MSFDHKEIEKKWQNYWDENQTFYTDVHDFSKPKYYALDKMCIRDSSKCEQDRP